MTGLRRDLHQWLGRAARDDQAQDLIEYALLVGFICFVAFVGVTRVSAGMSDAYLSINLGIQPLAAPASGGDDGFRIGRTGSASTSEPCRGDEDSRTSRCADPLSGK